MVSYSFLFLLFSKLLSYIGSDDWWSLSGFTNKLILDPFLIHKWLFPGRLGVSVVKKEYLNQLS